MDINKIENRLNSLGQTHVDEVDTKALWLGVSKELDGKKKKLLFAWLLSGIIVVTLIGGFTAYGSTMAERVAEMKPMLHQESIFLAKNDETKGRSRESRILEAEQDDKIEIKRLNSSEGRVLQMTINAERVKKHEEEKERISDNTISLNGQSSNEVPLTTLKRNERNKSSLEVRSAVPTIDHVIEGGDNKGQSFFQVNRNLIESGTSKESLLESELKEETKDEILNYNLNPLPLRIALFELKSFDLLPPQKSLIQPIRDSKWRLGIYGGVQFNSID